jgi:hypothetical protein
MNKKFYTLLIATTIFSLATFAQKVTVTGDSMMKFPDAGRNIDYRVDINTLSINPLTLSDTNNLWNFSSASVDTTFGIIDTIVTDNKNPGITNSIYYTPNKTLAFGPLTLFGDFYYGTNANGFGGTGRVIKEQRTSLQGLTGTTNDSLILLDDVFNYPILANQLPFNFSVSDSIGNIYTLETNYILKAPTFGIPEAPGKNTQTLINEIVGAASGKLILPAVANIGGDDTINVLAIRYKTTIVDYFELAGNPAPPALLAALGLTQNDTNYEYRTMFYSPQYALSVANIFSNESGTITSAYMRRVAITEEKEQEPVSIIKMSANGNVTIFPNPAQNNVNLDLSKFDGIQQISISDISGRNVFTSNYTGGNVVSLDINQFQSGIYTVNVSNSNGRYISKLIVR